ncbi:amino acid adenylation domain-containing protein [Actinomadura fulvescens]|uniref:Carrier domain-containing protein n=1 Tax=Actinomadura fulvescens TaxID=46160 RepID=A0ABP6C7A0_9ACTN
MTVSRGRLPRSAEAAGPLQRDGAPLETLFADLVTAQADRTPGAPAIRQWDARVSYRELVDAAGALAHRLRRLGVRPETRVGICARRTPLLPVAALGIMMAGGAYVPLDPSHPRRRLADVVDDAGIEIVVADETGRSLLAGMGRRLVEPSLESAGPPPPCPALPANAAYVLYTSGSTGRPKGVVVSHRNAASFATMAGRFFGLDGGCRSVAFSALGFDVSVLDLFVPLTRGGCVQLVPDADRADPARLQRFLEVHEVTWGFIPPALLPLLDPGRLVHLEDLVTAGEPPGPEQVARWSRTCTFHNWYGPTEATVCTVGAELEGDWDRPLPIGRALPGCQAYVLDQDLRPCPPGTPGELYLGGPQVARGYLARPGRTAAAFVPDPFGTVPGARLYRTGDQVVTEPDGRIGFLGRLDRQVKIRGQRVEIGDIESVLRAHPDVLQAVADVQDAGDGTLVAYLTPADAPGLAELREYCAERLPGYMIPSLVVRLAALPLNASGKVDLTALRGLRDTGAVTEDIADDSAADDAAFSGTPIEIGVQRIWARVLEPSGPPRPDDDFLACGGHSLRAMRLVSALRSELGRAVTVEDVYTGRTVRGLAERVEKAEPITEAVPTGNAPALSSAQLRMWFVERLAPGIPVHNVALAERVRGPLDVEALHTALAAVVARHEPLRWRIPDRAGVPYVEVTPPGPIAIPVTDLSELAPAERERALDVLLKTEARTPFDLVAGPLWRARLVRLGPGDHVLSCTVHHVVFDGWSQDVLFQDLADAYADAVAGRAPGLRPPDVGFADYVAWAADRAARGAESGLEWWTEHLRDAPTVCDLPRDRSRPPMQTFNGAVRHAAVDAEMAAAVDDLARRAGSTPYVVLLAAFGQLLRRLTGQDDLIVGTPYADRGHVGFEPLVGLCLQVLPVRLRMADDVSFADHVRSCAREVGAVTAHPDLPLERLVAELGLRRDLTRNPLTQVLFNMHDFARPRLRLSGCAVEPLRAGLPGALFDLTLYVSEDTSGLALQAVYNPDLYDEARIESLLAGYVRLLGELVAEPQRPVRNASLRSPAARLPGWSTPPAAGADGPGLIERMERSERDRPDEAAITGSTAALTFREVGELRGRTAASVRAAGVASGETVAVLGARDIALPALMLGVLASGARWVVLDPALPEPVLARQATAAGARALLPCPGVPVLASLAHLPVIEIGDHAPQPPAPPAPPDERGYLALTSGTTGAPQVVVTPERPLAHFLTWYAATFRPVPEDRFALLAGLAHDPLLRDAFIPLVTGARLAVPEQEWLRDPARLAAWLFAEQITILHLTPQLARLLCGVSAVALSEVRLVAFGGDQLRPADVARIRVLAPNARVVNFYGATETPQVHAWHEVPAAPARPDGDAVPVGRGVDGSRLIVLGRNGEPAGTGELGEVVVRSRNLADGYRDAALTARRFGRPPGSPDPSDRLYRTGDLGRHRPDGSVVLAGRADDQLKVRGYRVELGEIDAVLASHPGVQATAVVADRDNGEHDNGERVLRAFAVPADPDVRASDLLELLRARLPEHAVPGEVRLVPAIPLTPAGKVDRRALPRLVFRPHRPVGGELTTATERMVAQVWRTVLGRSRIGGGDNFFEIGGHSLAIASVQARLSELMGRQIPIVDLFRYPNVRALAGHLDGTRRSPGAGRAAGRAMTRRRRQSEALGPQRRRLARSAGRTDGPVEDEKETLDDASAHRRPHR